MAKIQTVPATSDTKYPYPVLNGDETKEAKAEVLKVRAASSRAAARDVVAALVNAPDDLSAVSIRAAALDALTFLAARADKRKGTPGEGVARAPKANVVAEYFAEKAVGDKVDAADVFFDLDMDPARVLSSLKRFVSSVKDHDKRLWISYSKADRAYVINGRGAEVPAGFTAYGVETEAADVA